MMFNLPNSGYEMSPEVLSKIALKSSIFNLVLKESKGEITKGKLGTLVYSEQSKLKEELFKWFQIADRLFEQKVLDTEKKNEAVDKEKLSYLLKMLEIGNLIINGLGDGNGLSLLLDFIEYKYRNFLLNILFVSGYQIGNDEELINVAAKFFSNRFSIFFMSKANVEEIIKGIMNYGVDIKTFIENNT